MAKTISQSINSLESSNTSLSNSLSKCKTSIANKGVSVPSTTRFSGLPALIDKILEPKCDITFNSGETIHVRLYSARPSGDVLLEEYSNTTGDTYKDFLLKVENLSGYYCPTFAYKDRGIEWKDAVWLYGNMGYHLTPEKFLVLSDDFKQIYRCSTIIDGKAHYFQYNQLFGYANNYGDVDTINIEFSSSSRYKDFSVSIPSQKTNVSWICVLYINTSDKTWTLWRLVEDLMSPINLEKSGTISTK